MDSSIPPPRRKHRKSEQAAFEPHSGLKEGKDIANKAKAQTNVSLARIAEAIRRSKETAARMFSRRDQRYHVRYGDLLEMSRRTHTRVLVAELVAQLQSNLERPL